MVVQAGHLLIRQERDSACSDPHRSAADEECFDAYQSELNYIYRSLRRLGAESADVEDLAQEIFLALRGAWPAYDATRPLRPYLFAIAFRITMAHRRKRRRALVRERLETEDPAPGPDQALEAEQSRALLLRAIERIPLPRRAVLIMYELDEVPIAEISQVLCTSPFTLYSRLRKARIELQTALRRLARDT